MPTHRWKDLSIDFVTRLPILANWKGDSYDSILVIVDRLTKMVYYKPVKVTINALGLAKVILNVIIWHHGISNSIVTDRSSLLNLSSGHHYAISLVSSEDSLPSSIHRQTARSKGKIVS